jgi:RHS repeat-associated protein
MNLGNRTSETFSYNDRFQMTSQSLNKGAEVLQKYDYSYGTVILNDGTVNTLTNNGQLSKIEGFIGANKQWSQRFGYDALGRLSEAREYKQGNNAQLSYKQKFDFDRFGNLYRKTASNPTAGQQNPLLYTPIEDADISKATNRFATGTTYDDAGQVVTDNKFRTMSFGYDANGRQIKASRASVPDAWTVYDASGNRVATKINDVWQYMVYDAFGKLVAEYGVASGGVGGVKYVQQDWQGSVRTVSNNNGFVVARTDYQAFGEDIGYGTGLRSIEQGYSVGKVAKQGYGLTERDDATGLDHTWFRKNENKAGRWTSPDPYKGSMSLASPQSFNRYSYVENQPTNFVDPSGLYWAINYASCQYVGWYASGPGWDLQFFEVYSCQLEWIGPSGGGVDSTGGGGGGVTPGIDPRDPICAIAYTLFAAYLGCLYVASPMFCNPILTAALEAWVHCRGGAPPGSPPELPPPGKPKPKPKKPGPKPKPETARSAQLRATAPSTIGQNTPRGVGERAGRRPISGGASAWGGFGGAGDFGGGGAGGTWKQP